MTSHYHSPIITSHNCIASYLRQQWKRCQEGRLTSKSSGNRNLADGPVAGTMLLTFLPNYGEDGPLHADAYSGVY